MLTMTNEFNINLFKLINNFSGTSIVLDFFMIFCAKYLIYFITLLLIGLFFYKKKYRTLIILAFISGVFGLLISKIISSFYYSPRPFILNLGNTLVSHNDDSSFPSDHMTIISSLTFTLLFLNKNKKLNIALIITSCLIGFSRIFVGVHFPFDIIGSIMVALVSSSIVYFYKNKLFKFFYFQ